MTESKASTARSEGQQHLVRDPDVWYVRNAGLITELLHEESSQCSMVLTLLHKCHLSSGKKKRRLKKNLKKKNLFPIRRS